MTKDFVVVKVVKGCPELPERAVELKSKSKLNQIKVYQDFPVPHSTAVAVGYGVDTFYVDSERRPCNDPTFSTFRNLQPNFDHWHHTS